MQHASTEKLRHDLRVVLEDTEELLEATASQTGERIEKVRARAQETLREARSRLQEAGSDAAEAAFATAREVDGKVHDSPWTAIGIAAGVGALLGFLAGRR